MNSAIGSRKRYTRKKKPTMAPVVRPDSGPMATPAAMTLATVSTENTSPEGNRRAARMPARMPSSRWRSMAWFTWVVMRGTMR